MHQTQYSGRGAEKDCIERDSGIYGTFRNVDPVIWKLFSPSVTLDDVEKEFEDYSCFTFPALRALEGYLKYLLSEKNIVIDETHNFGTVFNKDSNDKAKKHQV